jgi:hypothetical protein
MAADAGVSSHDRVYSWMRDRPEHDYSRLDAEPDGRHEANAASRGLRHRLNFIT